MDGEVDEVNKRQRVCMCVSNGALTQGKDDATARNRRTARCHWPCRGLVKLPRHVGVRGPTADSMRSQRARPEKGWTSCARRAWRNVDM